MKTITTTSTTQITRVRFASPQAANRTLVVGISGVSGGSYASMHRSATSKAPAFKDVSYLRSRRPPV
jgi:hypothetical protein